ncbi:sulfotransferase family 2 domain-containing protein [Chloroflexota bacterium]
MLLSHKRQFIFIHIYKTAGTSVRRVFLPHARLVDRLVYEFRGTKKAVNAINRRMHWVDDGNRQFTGYHKHATALEIQEKLGRERFDRYFSFAFVRNPYDWIVSLYHFIGQAPRHRDHERIVSLTFGQFVEWHLAQQPPTELDFVVGKDGSIIVDYIGKVERIREDVASICGSLDLPVPAVPHANPSVLRTRPDYNAYYDSHSRALVKEYFARDLDAFGYDFLGSGQPE